MAIATSVTTTLPGAPTGVSAAAGTRSATVTWTPPSNNGGCAITGYTVSSFPTGLIATVSGTTTSARINKLRNGVTYTFTVAATNCVGSGVPSAPTNTVTPTKP